MTQNGKDKRARIDLGLAVLGCHCRYDYPLELADIAAWAGCTPQMISLIEHRALRKIRRKFNRDEMELIGKLLGNK